MKLTEENDVVIGCITGYDFETIKPWVNSLDTCGFKGHKMVLCYNVQKPVMDELLVRNYTVLAFAQDQHGNAVYKPGQPFSIVVERFFHIWAMLKDQKYKYTYRNMLHTDVKDVVFQRNPSEFMEEVLQEKPGHWNIIAASESLIYQDEDWGRQIDSFGNVIYESMKHTEIVNAGTLSGKFEDLLDFFLNVYMVSVGGRVHNPDQAAVNVLLNQHPFIDTTYVTQPRHAWACQAGTTNDPLKTHYIPKLTSSGAGQSYCDNGIVYSFAKEPFYLVHQYDRVPEWKEEILRKYG
jgi:hypothetical protein